MKNLAKHSIGGFVKKWIPAFNEDRTRKLTAEIFDKIDMTPNNAFNEHLKDIIGDEYDSTQQGNFHGISHYNGLYDQSRFFDET